MKIEVLGVYLVDFKNNIGGELNGKHYALIISKKSNDKTYISVPITSKKKGKKYRSGITIDCTKYQKAPTYDKAFIRIDEIREISFQRVYGKKVYSLDDEDAQKFIEKFNLFFKLKE